MTDILKPKELLHVITQSIFDCGWNVIYLDSSKNPFKIKIFNANESHLLKIIIYNISHGGGYMRSKNEYRIQMKATEPDLAQEVDCKTLILGYYKKLNVFAGWNVQKHRQPRFSASFQIKEENLYAAESSGFSPCNKENEEIAIAFRPDMFVEYVRNLEVLHSFGKSMKDFDILNEVTKKETAQNSDLINQIEDNKRKTVLKTISQKQRDNNFRAKVLSAYNNRCAFTGLQLKLVEAAHIIPVSDEKSKDCTSNGIALSALCHRAYDRGLITFNDEFKIIINEKEINKLKCLNLGGGFENFKNNLRSKIEIPADIDNRPNIEYIKYANKLRGWN